MEENNNNNNSNIIIISPVWALLLLLFLLYGPHSGDQKVIESVNSDESARVQSHTRSTQ